MGTKSGSVSCAPRVRQASPRHGPHRALAGTYASLGPPWLRSKTCRGFRYQRKDCMILAPCGRPGTDRESGEAVRGGGLRWEARGCGNPAQEEARGGDRRGFSQHHGAEADLGTWEHLLGGGAELDPTPSPRLSEETGCCAYLVAPTLGVHKHQQGLHEGGRGRPDDEGSPAALLGDRERCKAGSCSGGPSPCPPCPGCPRDYHRGVRPHSGPGPRGRPDLLPCLGAPEPRLTQQRPSWQHHQLQAGAQGSKKQAPLSCSPSRCPPGPTSNLRPFLARLPLEGCSLFLLAGFEGVLQGKWGCG